jgi:hypothetical protein
MNHFLSFVACAYVGELEGLHSNNQLVSLFFLRLRLTMSTANEVLLDMSRTLSLVENVSCD